MCDPRLGLAIVRAIGDTAVIISIHNGIARAGRLLQVGTHIPHFGKVASKKPNFTLLRFSKYN